MYLKDYSPYLDSSLLIVNLRIQLELICWALYSAVNTLLRCVLSTLPSPIRTPRSISYKCS